MKEDKNVMEIGLSTRSMNRFIRNGIYWVSDIVKFKSTDLGIRFSGIGEISKEEIIDKIHKFGFVFSDEDGYSDQKIIMPASFLDTPLAEAPYVLDKNFFKTRNIITIRDLINISEEEFQNMPPEIKQFIIDFFQIMKLEFTFKNKANGENNAITSNEEKVASLEKEIEKLQTENALKKKLLQQIEKLLVEFETLNEEKEELDKKLDSAFERLNEMRGKTNGK